MLTSRALIVEDNDRMTRTIGRLNEEPVNPAERAA